ncbi:hypothetical protein Pfo_008247, partial [Paulownia fortunei]
MPEVVENGPVTLPANSGEISSLVVSASPTLRQYNLPSLPRKPLLSIEHSNATSSADKANLKTPLTPNFVTPLGSPLRNNSYRSFYQCRRGLQISEKSILHSHLLGLKYNLYPSLLLVKLQLKKKNQRILDIEVWGLGFFA